MIDRWKSFTHVRSRSSALPQGPEEDRGRFAWAMEPHDERLAPNGPWRCRRRERTEAMPTAPARAIGHGPACGTCRSLCGQTASGLGWRMDGAEGAFARRAPHPNQCPGDPSQCFGPQHPSLLQPRLPHPRRLGGPNEQAEWLHRPCLRGGPKHGDKKMERKTGDNLENRGRALPGALLSSLMPRRGLLETARRMGTAGLTWADRLGIGLTEGVQGMGRALRRGPRQMRPTPNTC
jgi:hypothetical protein|mmetsp:Transcript_68884/g.110292  ORF Transcript_68884/g.110292 Transcript_68884/m.110292 type:complete len:235 (+) Transcript_68884:1489-2193(+)